MTNVNNMSLSIHKNKLLDVSLDLLASSNEKNAVLW